MSAKSKQGSNRGQILQMIGDALPNHTARVLRHVAASDLTSDGELQRFMMWTMSSTGPSLVKKLGAMLGWAWDRGLL